jgi:hypothetical protein
MRVVLYDNVVKYTDNETHKNYLVNPEFGEIFEVNQTAKIIFDCIKDGIPMEDIVKKLCDCFLDVT